MDTQINTTALLEWYMESGVDATCGDVAGLLQEMPEKPHSAPSPRTTVCYQTAERPSITPLAQANTQACTDARRLCAKAQTLDELQQVVTEFEGCALKFNAKSTVFGAGNPQASLMIIGEAPGADEDRLGQPFVGKSGQLLEQMLAAVGLKRDDVYITNVLPWRPPGNRTPTSAEVAVCLPFLKRQIELIAPSILLLLGGSAAGALLDTTDPISKLRGHWIEYKQIAKPAIAALASFHPAYLLRNPAQKAKAWNDFLRIGKKLKEN